MIHTPTLHDRLFLIHFSSTVLLQHQFIFYALRRASLPFQPLFLVRVVGGLDPLHIQLKITPQLVCEHEPKGANLPRVQGDLVVLHIPLVGLEERGERELRTKPNQTKPNNNRTLSKRRKEKKKEKNSNRAAEFPAL